MERKKVNKAKAQVVETPIVETPIVESVTQSSVKQTWRNTGATFRYNNKIIKPGEVFQEDPANIPQAFRDVLQPIFDGLESVQSPKVMETPKVKFIIIEQAETGLFDVVNLNGKAINDAGLTFQAAEDLKNKLE